MKAGGGRGARAGPGGRPLAGLAGFVLLASAAALPARAAGGGQDAEPARGGSASDSVEALDARAASVAAELRCPVCRNQSVLESSAELSREMQRLIRERLAAGDSPQEVKEYFVGRYGEWILLQPEPEGLNLVVYLLPALALVGGGVAVAVLLRRWAGRSDEPPRPAGVTGPASDGDHTTPPGEGARKGPIGKRSHEPPLQDRLSPEDRRWLEESMRGGGDGTRGGISGTL